MYLYYSNENVKIDSGEKKCILIPTVDNDLLLSAHRRAKKKKKSSVLKIKFV